MGQSVLKLDAGTEVLDFDKSMGILMILKVF